MFLSKISIHLYIIILCIVEKITFLRAFITEEILKRHMTDCFKINGKHRFIMPEKGEYFKFKNYERKIKSLFLIYTDFESILVREDNGKQNPEESYTNKY